MKKIIPPMTLYKFNKMTEIEQFNLLSSSGRKVAERKGEYYRYVLYQVGNLYVELRYHTDHLSMPALKSFNSSAKALQPYLETIDIAELIR